jgi:2-hydroxychromene-2-carboxylate isomerase
MTARKFKFLYDIVCPYAYMASRQVRGIAQRTGAELEYVPVLLGGLYKETKVPCSA